MYGTGRADFPRRIVCLTAETTEIAFHWAPGTGSSACRAPRGGRTAAREGPGGRVHDLPARQDPGARARPGAGLLRPPARRRPRPDRRRRRRALHQSALDRRSPAGHPRDRRSAGVRGARARSSRTCRTRSGRSASTRRSGPTARASTSRSGSSPLIAGIRWVSEAIEIAGGRDVFPELRERQARAGGSSSPRRSSGAIRRSSSPPGAASPWTAPRSPRGRAGRRSPR